MWHPNHQHSTSKKLWSLLQTTLSRFYKSGFRDHLNLGVFTTMVAKTAKVYKTQFWDFRGFHDFRGFRDHHIFWGFDDHDCKREWLGTRVSHVISFLNIAICFCSYLRWWDEVKYKIEAGSSPHHWHLQRSNIEALDQIIICVFVCTSYSWKCLHLPFIKLASAGRRWR